MFRITNLHKVGNFLLRKKIPIIPKIFYFINYFLYNSIVPLNTDIGSNTKFAYGGIGVVIQSGISIGNNVMIGQNVTIGGSFGGDKSKIGNNVFIGAGSRILSSTIGDNVVIGVNSVVVNKVIPDNTVVQGVPAKIVGHFDPNKHIW